MEPPEAVNVDVPPEQTEAGLLLATITGTRPIVSISVLGPLVPQEKVAVTEILPEVLPAVKLIEVVPCPELIIDPGGTAHV